MIGDLGLARELDKVRSSSIFAGTINYMSPESIKREKITFFTDIW